MEQTDQKIGIVLLNTGSPDSPQPRDIRTYLIEFLSDKNIIRVPHVFWLPILHGIIARTRPQKTAPRYEQIWTSQGAPLLVESYAQRDALNDRFTKDHLPFHAEVGMRYGSPSVESAIERLLDQGYSTIVGFPLFPQTALCTTASCTEKITRVITDWERSHPHSATTPKLAGVIEGYSDNPRYWCGLAHSIQEKWEWMPGSKVLFSLHSIPLSDVRRGDTYLQEAQASLTKTAALLGLAPKDWALTYHSRFEDSRTWAAPHPKTVLSRWANEGVERVALVTPGFAADNLESLYDIAYVAKQYFEKRCAEKGIAPSVTYIPALNHRSDHIDLLLDVITTYCDSLYKTSQT